MVDRVLSAGLSGMYASKRPTYQSPARQMLTGCSILKLWIDVELSERAFAFVSMPSLLFFFFLLSRP